MLVKYNSIENSYREKFINLIREQHPNVANDTWYVTEKLHGSSLGIIYDFETDTIKYQSRNQFTDKSFMGLSNISDDLEKGIKILRDKEIFDNIKQFTVYGEIFGQGIQKGIQYGPDKYFRFFDIMLVEQDQQCWVNQDKLQLLENEYLKMVPLLGSGKFDKCLEWQEEFDSHILSISNNKAEGIVIKPNSTAFTKIGSRIILKKKTDKFSEIAHDKKEKTQLSALPDEVSCYLTLNRLNNAFSKVEPKFENFGKILKEFNIDILNELFKDEVEVDFDKKALMNECGIMIRSELKKRL